MHGTQLLNMFLGHCMLLLLVTLLPATAHCPEKYSYDAECRGSSCQSQWLWASVPLTIHACPPPVDSGVAGGATICTVRRSNAHCASRSNVMGKARKLRLQLSTCPLVRYEVTGMKSFSLFSLATLEVVSSGNETTLEVAPCLST